MDVARHALPYQCPGIAQSAQRQNRVRDSAHSILRTAVIDLRDMHHVVLRVTYNRQKMRVLRASRLRFGI